MSLSTWSDEYLATVVASLVGFLGVVLTLLWNAYLSRRAQHSQWENERSRIESDQRHERLALRTALLSELRVAREHTRRTLATYEEVKAPADGKPSRGAVVPISDFDQIFRASLPRIGLLSASEVDKVVAAYAKLRARHAALRTLHSAAPRNDEFVIVLTEMMDSEIRTTSNMLAFVDSAIDTVQTALEAEAP